MGDRQVGKRLGTGEVKYKEVVRQVSVGDGNEGKEVMSARREDEGET